ncbi:MAG: HlyD family efflux transporter periplasmic adaptor subunit [Verrucomicrobiota bacterium]|nr:HlyD family efflux transporter periplasmic adaptor subunit [Verrucomicrobiota bacterium]
MELDPTNLEERINSQEIDVVKAQSALVRAEGGLETMKLSTALELKRAENSHQNSVLELKKVENSTVETHIKDMVGTIANLEKDVELAQKNVKAYDGLKELGFVSDVEVLKEKAKEAKTLHQIKIAQAELAAYREYDQVKLISASRLAVDEAEVTIKKTQVKNAADLNDANSTVLTAQKTLELQIEKLRDLQEQMANSRIYAPDKGAVVYWSESSRHYRGSSEPIMDGAKVHRGQKIMKLPKTDSLKVGVTIPQSSRKDVRRGMKAWVQVENAILRGTVTMLASTVDTNQRNHSNKSGFRAEVAIDEDQVLPDSVSEGMKAKVEILVKELKGKNRLIKIPNQCVTSRTLGEDKSETGCWVLNEGTGKNVWRPITIAYHDEDFIAVADQKAGSGIGLEEGEMILLSPLSEADQLNLGESVQNKGDIKGVEPLEDDGKTVDPLAKGTKLPSDEPSLTDDQKAKLETAKTKMKEKIAQLRAKGLPPEEARNKFKEELKTFLTEQQIAQLEKKRSERSRGDGRNSDRRRGGDNVTEESRDKGPRESDREEGPPRKGKKKFLLKKL